MVLYHSPSFNGFQMYEEGVIDSKGFDYKDQYSQIQTIPPPISYYPSPNINTSMRFGDVVGEAVPINGFDSIASNTADNTAVTFRGNNTGNNDKGNPKKNRSIYYNNVANIVCLLWFNDINILLKSLNEAQTTNSYTNCKNQSFSRHSIPTNAFKQFISNVITRTQLPPTAVSLALLYILRLKRYAPVSIVGSANSEYRVFSVALILTNKYLDDNTYTNKTWSDITRLPLKELSAMEIEFLGNMTYSLHVDQNEWRAWQRQLKVWLNIHYWVCDYINNKNTPPTTVTPATYTSSATTSPTSSNSNLSYLSLVSPPLRGVINPPPMPISINQFQLYHSQHPSPISTAPHYIASPPIVPPSIPTTTTIPLSLPTPPMITPISTNQSHKRTNPYEITPPITSRKRMYTEDTTSQPLKRQAVQVVHPTTYTHQPPALRTLINTNMPSFQPTPPQTTQPIQPLQSAPIYYVISQKKTFSPHYGYPQSTYLLPQQYQFELQHYTPSRPSHPSSHMSSSSHLRPVQFLSPTTSTSNNSYWRTPNANEHRYHVNTAYQQFSSPPPHY